MLWVNFWVWAKFPTPVARGLCNKKKERKKNDSKMDKVGIIRNILFGIISMCKRRRISHKLDQRSVRDSPALHIDKIPRRKQLYTFLL